MTTTGKSTNETHAYAGLRRLARRAVVRLPARRTRWDWLGLALCAAGVLEVPWIFVLAATLPRSQFPLTWVGLDVCEAVGLMTTGAGLLRREPLTALAASVTATLLALDAWFDVTTATTGADRAAALAMAFVAEVPIAGVCVAVAAHLSAATRPRADAVAGDLPSTAGGARTGAQGGRRGGARTRTRGAAARAAGVRSRARRTTVGLHRTAHAYQAPAGRGGADRTARAAPLPTQRDGRAAISRRAAVSGKLGS